MRYRMRQKLLSWGNDFTIQDQDGNDVFFVDGKVFSIGDKLSFQDMDGTELLFIEQKVFSWGPSYELQQGGSVVATVKKELFTFFKDKFEVDIPGPNDYHVEGNIFDYEFTFTRTRGDLAARVSKKFFSFSDSYGVDVVDGEDDLLILATAVIIDQVCHNSSNK
ncbi:MAG: hypothetical protein ACI841_001951 [Planctomycetota bacterium]|jgi:uncharacterized protein YxjI